MEIQKDKVLVLGDDEKEFGVVDKITYNNEEYVYLVTMEGKEKVKICKVIYEDDDTILEDVVDIEVIREVLLRVEKEGE